MTRKPARNAARRNDTVAAGGRTPWTEWGVTLATSTVVVSRLITATEGAALGETLWIVQLTLLALLLWIFAAFREGAIRWRFDRCDAGVTLIVSGELLSAAWNWSEADRRGMVNMLWEWIGLWVTWFLLRRLARPDLRRQAVVAFFALVVTFSGLGIWQHYSGFAEMRNEVARLQREWDQVQEEERPADPREARVWDQKVQRLRGEFARMRIPTDAGARLLWDQRVNASSEPVGLFALANTFAGVLLAALIVGGGILLRERVDHSRRLWRSAVTAGLCLPIFFTLVLTKSRTAYVGCVVGFLSGFVAMRLGAQTGRRYWMWGAGAIAGLIGVVVVASLTGGLDRLVVLESFKSLKYRGEYWLGSWRMLTSEPERMLLGVGASNFRANYLQFKLPESSEEIGDPHNMVLDLWSSGGLVGLAGLCWLLATGVAPLWRGNESEPTEAAPADAPTGHSSPFRIESIFAGTLVAFGATWLTGGADDRLLPLAFGWCTLYFLDRIIEWPVPRLVWFGAAFLAVAVHLLGAGGIAMPAVTQTLLFLAAFGVSERKVPARSGVIASRGGWLAIVTGGVGLYLLCWFTALIPVMNARADLAAGDQALIESVSFERAQRSYKRAAEADPLSGEACERLAELNLQRWLASTESESEQFDQCVYWQRLDIVRQPRDHRGYRALGAAYLTRFDRTRNPDDALLAADEFSRAAALYPNHAELQSELAEANLLAGQEDAARVFAARSRELDEINRAAGHIDKVLSEKRLKLLDRILAPQVPVPPIGGEGEESESEL